MSQPQPTCKACGEPVSLERGITAVGDLNAPGIDYYCEPCAPNRSRGYTIADLERWKRTGYGVDPNQLAFRHYADDPDCRCYRCAGTLVYTTRAPASGPPLIPGVDVHLGERWGEADVKRAQAEGRLAEHMAEHGFYPEGGEEL